jgi:hypothetical protein
LGQGAAPEYRLLRVSGGISTNGGDHALAIVPPPDKTGLATPLY